MQPFIKTADRLPDDGQRVDYIHKEYPDTIWRGVIYRSGTIGYIDKVEEWRPADETDTLNK